MSEATKSYWAKGAVLLSLTIGVSPAVTFATPIDLTANFRLFGEVNRFSSLGFGDMFVSFGINPAGGAVSGIERGRIEYFVGSQPITTGVLAPLSLPNFGWGVVDFEFSVPFALDVDQGASMFIGLGTNFIGSAAGASGSKQVIFDFSDNIYYAGSPLVGCHARFYEVQVAVLSCPAGEPDRDEP